MRELCTFPTIRYVAQSQNLLVGSLVNLEGAKPLRIYTFRGATIPLPPALLPMLFYPASLSDMKLFHSHVVCIYYCMLHMVNKDETFGQFWLSFSASFLKNVDTKNFDIMNITMEMCNECKHKIFIY